MRKPINYRVLLGILIWIGCGTGLVWFCVSLNDRAHGMPSQLLGYLTSPVQRLEISFEQPQVIRIGDPVFADIDGRPQVIGRIYQVEDEDSTESHFVYTDRAFLELNSCAPQIYQGDYFTFHQTPDNIGWVIETMLPQSTRQEIGDLMLVAFQEHHRELLDAFQPLIEDTIRDAANVIGQDITKAVKNREQEFTQIGQRFRRDLIDKQIVPLIQRVIWPIVQHESKPLLDQIGRELWREVSIWRFTWRAIYDASPLPDQGLTGKEFNRFVRNKATPILESHLPDFIRVQRSILNEISRNEQVEQVVLDSLRQVTRDPELQQLFVEILKEVLIGNERLERTIRDHWTSPEALAALETANRKLDPTIVKIGSLLFGAIDEEIAEDFAMVLRNRIMRKDNRWLHLVSKSDSESLADGETPIRVVRGSDKAMFPGRVESDWLKLNQRSEE